MTPNENSRIVNEIPVIEEHEAHITHEHTTDHSHHHIRQGKDSRLTTPLAIVIGSVIISLGLVGYGYTSSLSNGSTPTTNPLPKILKAVGVNKKDFESCVISGKEASLVTASLQDGITAGVQGTPTSFVILKRDNILYTVASVEGAQTEEYVRAAVEKALALHADPKSSLKGLKTFQGKTIDDIDYVEGTDTGVFIVEYSDPECPFCVRFHPTIEKIRSEYAGRIAFIYRHFPLSIHPGAQKESEMISCAGALKGREAYYKYIDAMFDYKIKNNITTLPIPGQQQ